MEAKGDEVLEMARKLQEVLLSSTGLPRQPQAGSQWVRIILFDGCTKIGFCHPLAPSGRGFVLRR